MYKVQEPEQQCKRKLLGIVRWQNTEEQQQHRQEAAEMLITEEDETCE